MRLTLERVLILCGVSVICDMNYTLNQLNKQIINVVGDNDRKTIEIDR